MPLFKRGPGPDRITPAALADYGRYEFLGADQSGIAAMDVYPLISELVPLCLPDDAAGHARATAELRRHAQHGEWHKVGAWKFAREFLSEDDDIIDLVDAGLLAIDRMRVTNLAIHLAPIDAPRFTELTGAAPRNDGFFGPPVFESDFGPARQYYLDQAVATAAGRRINRLESVAGIPPESLADVARSMWDLGLLVYRGPLVVNPDIAFEPHVVARAKAAATRVDHFLFTDRLADTVLEQAHGLWAALGATRFVEDYLDPASVTAPGYARLLDTGIELLVASGQLGINISTGVLTPRQRERLSAVRAAS